MQTFSVRASPLVGSANSQALRPRARVAVRASQTVSQEGFEMMRKGVKVAADETVLTPRYVTAGGRGHGEENGPQSRTAVWIRRLVPRRARCFRASILWR